MRFVVAILLVSNVALAGDDVEIEGRDSTALRGDAMVWEDAAFYLEPWTGGSHVRFSSLARDRDVGRAVPVKIVSAQMRDFVEIELVKDESCTWRRVTVDDWLAGLRLFVKRSDLAPVLVKPYAITYANGTSAKLAAGVPVTPTASGAYMLAARGDVLRLPIPHASVGFTYTRSRAEEPPPPEGTRWRFDRTLTVKLGDTDIEARAPWLATMPAKHGDTVKVKWATRCIELVVAAPAKSLRKEPTLTHVLTPLFPRDSPPRDQHSINGLTPLSTTGGREVALAAHAIMVGPPAHGRACFDATLTLNRLDDKGRIERKVRLCASADAVTGPPVDPTAIETDPLAPPPDVAAPPRDAQRTASGVFYKRLVSRAARRPTADDTVLVHYTGWTTDGTMFDSSVKRGQPARFPLRSLIAGWTEGLQVMAVGEKLRFWIPEELAYKGSPGAPQGMLVFDVELLDID